MSTNQALPIVYRRSMELNQILFQKNPSSISASITAASTLKTGKRLWFEHFFTYYNPQFEQMP